MAKKILISTGGSGGHVIPATVFFDHLKDKFEVFISSDLRGSKYLNKNQFNPIIIDSPKISNNILLLPYQIFLIFFLSAKSFFIMKNKKIDILISTGGYMSLPLCFAAKFLGIKIILFEPNMVLGRANKIFLKFSKKIFCYSKEIKNFPEKLLKKIIVINPLVRKSFYSSIQSKQDENDNPFNLMIVGGSQGAKIFDENIKESVADLSLKHKLKVIQQTNINNIENLKNFYFNINIDNYIFEYDENFFELVSSSNLCITRAGASTISELVFLKIPFLAIPLPSAKDNHQFENANFYKNKDCCWILDQKDFNTKKLNKILCEIIENKKDYLEKKKNMQNFNYQNTWNNINQKIIDTVNEN
tara:strand:+ start:182 stop:1258 length:1077 start_codon:yes stop_codon:yes gene_type:complete